MGNQNKKVLRVTELTKRFGKHKAVDGISFSVERGQIFGLLALLHQPEIVFLDELTTGLDPEGRRDVWKYLHNLKNQGLSILLTSHYMDEVTRLCDRVLIMAEGKELIQGSPEEVIRKSGTGTMEDAYLHFVKEYMSEGERDENTVYAV